MAKFKIGDVVRIRQSCDDRYVRIRSGHICRIVAGLTPGGWEYMAARIDRMEEARGFSETELERVEKNTYGEM